MTDAFPIWATNRIELDRFVEELAAVGYPACNQRSAQRAAAAAIGYDDLDDFLDGLCDYDIEYIEKELERKVSS